MKHKKNPGTSRLEILVAAAEILQEGSPDKFIRENVEQVKRTLYIHAKALNERADDIASQLIVDLVDSTVEQPSADTGVFYVN